MCILEKGADSGDGHRTAPRHGSAAGPRHDCGWRRLPHGGHHRRRSTVDLGTRSLQRPRPGLPRTRLRERYEEEQERARESEGGRGGGRESERERENERETTGRRGGRKRERARECARKRVRAKSERFYECASLSGSDDVAGRDGALGHKDRECQLLPCRVRPPPGCSTGSYNLAHR
jgi:hypothetical protein